MIYVETSALLKILFREGEYAETAEILEAEQIACTSLLTFLESRRAVVRLVSLKSITEATAQDVYSSLVHLKDAWHVMHITQDVMERASKPYAEEPIRALDAIHLASALEFRMAFKDLKVLSFDKRIIANLKPLGLNSATS